MPDAPMTSLHSLRTPVKSFHGETHNAEIFAAILAGLAGLAKYISDGMKNKQPFKLAEAVAKFFISAVVGVIMFSLLQSQGWNGNMIGGVCGIFGWLGADGMTWCVNMVLDYIKRHYK